MAHSARRVPSNCLRTCSASLVVRPRDLGVEHPSRVRTQHLHSSALCCFVTDVTCGPGQYLPLGKTQCSPCGPGTYSVGGGVRFEDWGEQGYAHIKQSFRQGPSGESCSTHACPPHSTTSSAWPSKQQISFVTYAQDSSTKQPMGSPCVAPHRPDPQP